jgi:hypothetical protein
MDSVQSVLGVIEAINYVSIMVGFIRLRNNECSFTMDDVIAGHIACKNKVFSHERLRETLIWMTALGFFDSVKEGLYTMTPAARVLLLQLSEVTLERMKSGEISPYA